MGEEVPLILTGVVKKRKGVETNALTGETVMWEEEQHYRVKEETDG